MLSLPNELILDVVSNLDQLPLARMMRANKRLWELLRSSLYKAPLFTSMNSLRSFTKHHNGLIEPDVKILDLTSIPHRWRDLIDNDVSELVTICRNITDLDLGYCQKLTMLTIKALFTFSMDLKCLGLSQCNHIEAWRLQFLKAPLNELSLSCIRGFSDELILGLVDQFELTVLDISGTAITDAGVEELLAATSLEYLDISGCSMVIGKYESTDTLTIVDDSMEVGDIL
jgi:Leucine Rich repeat